MAKKKRSRPSKPHRSRKPSKKKPAVASYATRRAHQNVRNSSAARRAARRHAARKRPFAGLRKSIPKKQAAVKKLIEDSHRLASKAGLTLDSLYTLVSAGLQKLTDRVNGVEKRQAQFEHAVTTVSTQPSLQLDAPKASSPELDDIEIPGVDVQDGQLEIDVDETWRWTEAHMLAFVKLAKEMDPPSLDLYTGRPRKMRKVLFDWMRTHDLEPSDLPPKGESFPEDLSPAMPDTKKIIVGFTGTRDGMTSAQAKTLRELIAKLKPAEFHHGDCVGSDEDAHEIVDKWRMGLADAGYHHHIHVHPPDNDKARARVKLREGDVLHEEQPYHARNKAIVEACDVLLATPHSDVETLQSGTWWTLRCAKKTGTKYKIIRPDGSIATKF